MSLRARLLMGAVAGVAAAIVVIAAANATWRTVEPARVAVPIDGSDVVLDQPRELTGVSQDASLALFAIIGGVSGVLVLMLEPKARMVASAFLGASGLMVASNAGITRSRVIVPDEWLADNAEKFTFGPPTAAPAIAIAGGLAMALAAAWLLLAARDAPRFSMPEGPPEGTGRDAGRDEGAWE